MGIHREFAGYALFQILGMFGLSCYILADTFFVANGLGNNGLAALNLAIPIYSFVNGSGLMLGVGGATKYMIFQSQGASREADQVFTRTMRTALYFSAGFVLIGLTLSPTITTLLGADGTVFAMTNTYLTVILLFSPVFLLNDVLLSFARNDGAPRLAMVAMLAGSGINIILDYVFIFPMHMGIFGAVLATGFAPVTSMLVLSRHRITGKNGFHLVPTSLAPRRTMELMALGVPSLVTELSAGVVIICFNLLLLGLQGNVGVAAYGVVANIAIVVSSLFTGLAQGVQPLLSRAYGRGDTRQIKLLLRDALAVLTAMALVLYAALFFGAEPITQIFNRDRDPQLLHIAAQGLRLYFSATWFLGFNLIASSFFPAIARPVPAQVISLLRGLILILPSAVGFSLLFGVTGVWLSVPVTEGATAVLGAVLLLRAVRLWKTE